MTKKKDKVTRAVSLLKALANENRLSLLLLLQEGEKSVNELVEESNLTQASVSQQLQRMRLEKLIIRRKEGQKAIYSLAGGDLESVMNVFYKLYFENVKNR